MNKHRISSTCQDGSWADIYVVPDAVSTYVSAGERPFSPGDRIVKVHYSAPKAERALGLVAMAKMPAGYDPLRRDWYYAELAPGGRRGSKLGQVNECIQCHRLAADDDFVFGLPLSLLRR